MSMTIGRASLATDPSSITQNGDQLTFTIDVLEASLAASKAIRMQLLGLERGEVIPMTWSGDSDYDGFYVVEGVSVAPVTTYQQNYLMRAALTVSRVRGGYAAPSIELIHVETVRSTANEAVTGTSGFYYVPDNFGTSVDMPNDETADSGAIDGDNSVGANTTLTYSIPPSSFYNGAAKIEQQDSGGSTWRALVGRQLATTDHEKLRIGNGLIRCAWDAGELVVEAYISSAWVEAGRFEFGNSATVFPYFGGRVLRNSVECSTVQFPLVESTVSPDARRLLSISVVRGAAHFDLNLSDLDSSVAWSVESSTTVAATSNTGYIIQTTPTASGTQWMIGSPGDWAADTTNGDIDATNPGGFATEVDAFIGVAGAGGRSALQVVSQYWAAVSQRQRVIT